MLLSRFWEYCKLYHNLVTSRSDPNSAPPLLGSDSEKSPNYGTVIWLVPGKVMLHNDFQITCLSKLDFVWLIQSTILS